MSDLVEIVISSDEFEEENEEKTETFVENDEREETDETRSIQSVQSTESTEQASETERREPTDETRSIQSVQSTESTEQASETERREPTEDSKSNEENGYFVNCVQNNNDNAHNPLDSLEHSSDSSSPRHLNGNPPVSIETSLTEDEASEPRETNQPTVVHSNSDNSIHPSPRSSPRSLTPSPSFEELKLKVDFCEGQITQLKQELAKERESSKSVISAIRQDTKTRLDKMRDELQESKRVKENMVMKFAGAERQILDIRRKADTLFKQNQELEKEKQAFMKRSQSLQSQGNVLEQHYEQKTSECAALRREIERLREELKASEVKVEWAQNKLKAEVEAHQRTKHRGDQAERQVEMLKLHEKQEEKESIKRLEEALNSSHRQCDTLEGEKRELMSRMEVLQEELTEEHRRRLEAEEEMSIQRQDLERSHHKQSELLDFTSKLSERNADLLSSNEHFGKRVDSLETEVAHRSDLCSQLEKQLHELQRTIEKERTLQRSEVTSIQRDLDAHIKEVGELSNKLEDREAQLRATSKKLDLQRKEILKLQHAFDKPAASSLSAMSAAAKSGSMESLNKDHEFQLDTDMLVHKIIKLQKSLARKCEKLEFLEEHAQQLTQDLQKKTRLIQQLMMREEGGVFTTPQSDAHKANLGQTLAQFELAKRGGGIMASMYNVNVQDAGMTLELSLEINKKLQSIVEDTLLKNMTLKDSMDTLGQEIAKLSQENRRLRVQLGGQVST